MVWHNYSRYSFINYFTSTSSPLFILLAKNPFPKNLFSIKTLQNLNTPYLFTNSFPFQQLTTFKSLLLYGLVWMRRYTWTSLKPISLFHSLFNRLALSKNFVKWGTILLYRVCDQYFGKQTIYY